MKRFLMLIVTLVFSVNTYSQSQIQGVSECLYSSKVLDGKPIIIYTKFGDDVYFVLNAGFQQQTLKFKQTQDFVSKSNDLGLYNIYEIKDGGVTFKIILSFNMNKYKVILDYYQDDRPRVDTYEMKQLF